MLPHQMINEVGISTPVSLHLIGEPSAFVARACELAIVLG
jgi:hypothetical protein